MASERDAKLASSARRAAERLGLAATWSVSGEPVDVENDFLYELYVLLRLVRALRETYKVRFVPGEGTWEYKFPAKPATKVGKPRFTVLDRETRESVAQLCAGTEIFDATGKTRAPDISFQKPDAPDHPTHQDTTMIWDAKYRKGGGRITGPEFSHFARWVELLGVRTSPPPSIDLGPLAAMAGNCLVTNGSESTETDGERTNRCVKEAAGFKPHYSPKIRP